MRTLEENTRGGLEGGADVGMLGCSAGNRMLGCQGSRGLAYVLGITSDFTQQASCIKPKQFLREK